MDGSGTIDADVDTDRGNGDAEASALAEAMLQGTPGEGAGPGHAHGHAHGHDPQMETLHRNLVELSQADAHAYLRTIYGLEQRVETLTVELDSRDAAIEALSTENSSLRRGLMRVSVKVTRILQFHCNYSKQTCDLSLTLYNFGSKLIVKM